MPRAISYGRRRAEDVHYDALIADQPAAPPPGVRDGLLARSRDLAARISPQVVHPYYVARIASTDNALHSPARALLWDSAAEDAIAGSPLPPGAESVAKTLAKPEAPSTDGPLEKIAKYVPAELITVTTLAFAALTPSGSDVWWLLAGGAVANVLYLYGTALHAYKETKEMPRWYFYPLSALALFLWALAVIPIVGKEFGIGGVHAEAQKTFALAFAAFLVPLLDMIATGLTDRYTEKHPSSQRSKRTSIAPRPGVLQGDAEAL